MMDIRRTNTILRHKDNSFESVLVKPFSCEGKYGWCEPQKRTKGALRIYPYSQEIEVEIFAGCNPGVWDIIIFLLLDKDVKTLSCEYQRKGRKLPYSMKVHESFSGSKDVFINFPDKTGLIKRRKHLLHISCYDKIVGIKKMYVGDFVEMVAALTEHYSSFQLFTSAKYEKPHFVEEEDIKTEVTRIY